MRLYNAGLSPNALRVRAVAAELGLDLEIVEVDLRDPEAKARDLGPLNPNRKVPVLVDGDFVLWESRAINGYLASLKPEAGLHPADARRRAVVDQWCYWGAIHLEPTVRKVTMERFFKKAFGMGQPDPAALESGIREVAQILPILDGALAGRDWITGELSLADFANATAFLYRVPAALDLSAAPNVRAWIDRLEARPSWQAATAPVKAFIAAHD